MKQKDDGGSGTSKDNMRSVTLGGSRLKYSESSSPIHQNSIKSNLIRTTRYTLATFLVFNLFDQLKNFSNLYFILLSMLQLIRSISLTDGTPTILFPISGVISIIMVKDAIEDYKRYVSDKKENESPTLIYSQEKKSFEEGQWKNIHPGDVIKVKRDEYMPADIILLDSSTGEENRICYIDTHNLDGENNLKVKSIPRQIPQKNCLDVLEGSKVLFEAPNPFIYEFKGSLELPGGTKIGVDINNLALRNSKLRNTEEIVGVVVYVGKETKISMNATRARKKFSDIESKIARYILMTFCLKMVICLLISAQYMVWLRKNREFATYLPQVTSLTREYFVVFGRWVLILLNFVPISLLVTIEITSSIQSWFISIDNLNDTSSLDKIQFCEVHCTRLNEDLGQISYVFSDKTGTLTCNEMVFRNAIVSGELFGDSEDAQLENLGGYVSNVDFKDKRFFEKINDPKIDEYLVFLSLCHSIITENREDGTIIYNSSSPDEIALVNFAKMCGYEFRGKNSQGKLDVKIKGVLHSFHLLYDLEFTSTR